MGDKMGRSRKLPDLPYFYSAGAEQFAFYRIPKAFFTEPALCEISLEAKLLYGLMLDRLALSARNGWVDEENRVFIYYTVDSIMEDLNCGNKKAVKLLNELDSEYGLIERKRQGQGKPTRIYVKNFSTLLQNRHFQKCQNDTSKSVKTTSLDVSGRHSNKTEINNTEFNKINPIYPPVNGDGDDGLNEYKRYRDYFLDQLEFDVLLANHPYDGEVLNEILELLVETVCSKRQYLHVCGEDIYWQPFTMRPLPLAVITVPSSTMISTAKKRNRSQGYIPIWLIGGRQTRKILVRGGDKPNAGGNNRKDHLPVYQGNEDNGGGFKGGD